ncbi:Scy1 protein [Candida orthopsilosis Co 90-125]|uniref:Scy1 protein n=1 Tax=Candida orthopsilosis (strain 90-125) TaxID=1136231 RepID=H8X1I1_CANO9|nr:Scy1 protein [Candida orthopsilosis Co 90-125]CCG22386.1 Scy1 protein [Candida orthopsilosis Co 90-125]
MLSSLGFKTGIRAAYNVSDNPSFVSEPWTVYPAKHKSSNRIVSVFIFDKSKFESQVHRMCQMSSLAANSSPKKVIKECYELIKFEVNQLSKLRHPQILTTLEPLEETKTKFIFATEAVVSDLNTVASKDLDELSIQKGLLQVAKGLQFIHNQCNIIHLNIQPSSIFINTQGDWKLAGFTFLKNLNEISPQERDNFFIMNTSSFIPFANLNLNFTAPELIVDPQPKLDFANDIWSFGMLIFYLYNYDECDSLINLHDTNSIQDYKHEFRKFESKFYSHRTSPTELRYILKKVPEKLYPLFPQLLARYPYDRLRLDQFIDSDFFNGTIIKAMWFIDEFTTKAIDEKLVFMRGLLEFDPTTQTDLIGQFPSAFRSSKILPLLIGQLINELTVLDETVAIDPNIDELISLSLEIVMAISKSLSALTFQDRVYNVLLKDSSSLSEKVYDVVFKDEAKSKKLKTFTKLINASVKTRLTLVKNLNVLQEKTNDKQFMSFIKTILDLVFTLAAKEQDQKEVQIELQEKFLDYIPNFTDKVDFSYMKNTFFPLLIKIFQATSVFSTKLKILNTFEKFVDARVIDKIIINEQFLPVTKSLKNREEEIVVRILKFFEKIVSNEDMNLDLKMLVDSIIPQCYTLAFECTDCDQKEFKSFMVIINKIQKAMMEKKLAQLPERHINGGTASGSEQGKVRGKPNFETLLESQAIKEPEKPETAPKSQVMQPTRKSSNSSRTATRSNTLNTARSKPTMTKPTPINLTQSTPLKFGATTTNNNNTTTSNLFDSLKSTYDRPAYHDNEGDDDFDDFQSANAINKIKSNNKINWTSEANKMKSLPTTPLSPTNNSKPPSMGNSTHNSSHVANNYPPGFNSSVLSPKGANMSPNRSNTTSPPQNKSGNTSGINADLLDLL